MAQKRLTSFSALKPFFLALFSLPFVYSPEICKLYSHYSRCAMQCFLLDFWPRRDCPGPSASREGRGGLHVLFGGGGRGVGVFAQNTFFAVIRHNFGWIDHPARRARVAQPFRHHRSLQLGGGVVGEQKSTVMVSENSVARMTVHRPQEYVLWISPILNEKSKSIKFVKSLGQCARWDTPNKNPFSTEQVQQMKRNQPTITHTNG